MDLSHIPMRGFPQPNPLVTVAPWRNRAACALQLIAVLCLISLVTCAVVGGYCITHMGSNEPQWLQGVWVPAFFGFLASLPLSIVFLYLAKSIAATAGRIVVPVRVLRNEAVLVKATPAASSFLIKELVVGSISGPAGALGSISAGKRLENPLINYEFVHGYRLRTGKAQVDRGWVWNVQPGEIIWLVPWGPLRNATTWSESRGHSSPLCRVSAPVAEWFERAASRAKRISQRRSRHRQLLKATRAARKRRQSYSKRA